MCLAFSVRCVLATPMEQILWRTYRTFLLWTFTRWIRAKILWEICRQQQPCSTGNRHRIMNLKQPYTPDLLNHVDLKSTNDVGKRQWQICQKFERGKCSLDYKKENMRGAARRKSINLNSLNWTIWMLMFYKNRYAWPSKPWMYILQVTGSSKAHSNVLWKEMKSMNWGWSSYAIIISKMRRSFNQNLTPKLFFKIDSSFCISY